MGLIVDFILVLIASLNVFIGYKRGLIKVAFSIFAFVIALIATLIFVKPVSQLIIKNTQIDDNIKALIIKNNVAKNDEDIKDYTEADENTIDKNTIDEKNNYIQQFIQNKITDTTKEAKNKVIETTADAISKKLIEVLTAILVFIAIRVILILLSFLSDSIAQLPIIKQCNEVGGIIYGILKAIVLIYLVLTIIFVITSIKGSGMVSNAIQKSYITKYLYDNNVVVSYCLLSKNLL